MAELTIEQKAKRYDEAIEKAKHYYYKGKAVAFTRCVVSDIFPELKKKTDEEMIQKLIAVCHLYYGEGVDAERDECLEWLEKQSEQKSKNETTDTCDSLIIKSKEFPASEKRDFGYFSETAEKTEPKFKVGDWIASKELNTALIVNIDDDKYEVEFIDGGKGFPHIKYVDRYFHLWSIEDAKDGDILVSLSKMHPFIFNGHYDEDTDYVYAYCGISDIIKDDSFYFDKYPDEEFKVWDSAENVRPATRDQRNLLFSKMKENGYKWDADKKELKLHSNV